MTAVVGRDPELAKIRSFLELPDGAPRVLLLEGEAGIGKSTLWRSGVGIAGEHGYQVLSHTAARSEAELSFTALRDLLDGAFDDVADELSGPQRQALAVALLREEPQGPPPDTGVLGVAFLAVLSALATRTTTVLALDDVQWLDASSAAVIAFALRRLGDDSVAVLLARRGTEGSPLELKPDALERVSVEPISIGALHQIIVDRFGAAYSRPVLRRLHETSGGNPFFALELVRALKQRAVEVSAGEPLPVPGELGMLLRARLAALSREAEEALLVAASLSSPTLALVGAVAGAGSVSALKQAAAAEVVELEGEQVCFAHPLLASAVYFGANEEQRRGVHRRLAAVVADPEQRARHLALSATAPDSEVAAALDRAATVALRRGAPQAAAQLAEQALRLTPPEDDEAILGRRLDAAGAHFESGETLRARGLFEAAAEAAPPGPRRAEALARLARVHLFEGDRVASIELCRRALAEAGDELELRSELEEGLAVSYYFNRENLVAAAAHARSAVEAARSLDRSPALAEALSAQGLVDGLLGRASARPAFDAALALEEVTDDLRVLRRPSFSHGVYLMWSDDLERALERFETLRGRALERGDESTLPLLLAHMSAIECFLGAWQAAGKWADQSYEAAVQTGQPPQQAYALAARALVHAHLGLEARTRSEAEEALTLERAPSAYGGATSRAALALLELSLENPQAAHEALDPLVEHFEAEGIIEPGAARFLPDEIEALVAIGELERARSLLARLEARARRLGRGSALAACARCRGLLAGAEADLAAALAALSEALEAYAALPLPFERARTLLALGGVQRRARQRRSARETLEEALRAFDELGASLWSERTRRELSRISGRAPSQGELTASERRVAELVAEGRTNREVAAALYLAPRTVEGTLSRVYMKLGVRSRTELARRLGAPQN